MTWGHESTGNMDHLRTLKVQMDGRPHNSSESGSYDNLGTCYPDETQKISKAIGAEIAIIRQVSSGGWYLYSS